MKYAIIGCGRISLNHIKAALNNNLEIVALCDLKEDKIKILKDKFPEIKDVKEYNDYLEMIDKENLDLVAISTESGKHAKVALDVISKKINIIIEKPIALSLKDARQIIEKAKENNVLVCTNHQNRFNKSILKIKQAVDNDDFGKISHGTVHIRWNRGKNYYDQAPWRGTWEQDGGALMNQCIHNIDLIRWMLGNEVTEVYAYTENVMHPYISAEDLGLAIVKFKNGTYATIEGTTNVYPSNLEETLYMFGSKGTAKAGGSSVNKIDVWKFQDGENEEDVINKFSEIHQNVYGNGHTPLYEDMIDAIKNKRQPFVNAEDGYRALELVLAIYKSAYTNQPVKFPLEDCSTLDFIGKFDK